MADGSNAMNSKNHTYQRWWLKIVGIVICLLGLLPFTTQKVLAAVAFDVASESTTGTLGSLNEASFTWSHNPTGVPKGVLVFVWNDGTTVETNSVTYDGVNLTNVSTAVDTVTETGRMSAWYLGSGVPTTDPANIVVNRNNNGTEMWAVGITVTAAGDTETTGYVILQEDQALAVQSVDDGSPGTNSMRFAGTYSGLNSPPAAGTGSTLLQNFDTGNFTGAVVRETTAGQGARNVGFSAGSDDVAAVHLAVRESVPTTFTGIAYTDDGTTVDTTATICAVVNAGTPACDATDGSGVFLISTLSSQAGDQVTFFYDGGTEFGNTVTVADGGNIIAGDNLKVFQNRVITRYEQGTSLTIVQMDAYDNDQNATDMLFDAEDAATDTLVLESNIELHIQTGYTFAPGGNITTQGTGGLHLDDSSTLTGSGSEAHVSAGRITIDSGATYTAPTSGTINAPYLTLTGTLASGNSTITLSGTTGTLFTIGGNFSGNSTLVFNPNADVTLFSGQFTVYNLQLSPTLETTSKTYTLGGNLYINGNFTVNPTAATSLALTIAPSGLISAAPTSTTMLSGTTSGTSVLDLRPASTDYNLTTGFLNIAAGGTLDASSTTTSLITLNGTSGTLFTRTGAFTAGGSTVVFNPNAAVTLTSGTFTSTYAFNNVSLTPAISTAGRTYTFGSEAIETTGDFLIQPSGTQLLTVAMAGNITVANNKTTTVSRSSTATSSLVTGASNPTLSTGNLSILTGGTLDGTGSSSTISLTANGTPFTRTGTYTPGSTTIAYAPASTTGVTVTSGSYYNITFNKAANTFSLAASGITATNDLTITAGVLDTVSGSNFPITVGRNWTNTPGTGGFLAQQGTVTFDTTTAAAITGATTFYNFTAATAGKTIKFGDATTFTINGLLTLTGSAGPSYVTLDSVTGGTTQWTINHQGTESISYASIKNSACDGSSTQIDAYTAGTNFNAGNNGTCWLFAEPVVSSDASIWKFDEGTGTTAYDVIGNTATGTLAGTNVPTWQTEEMCISGKCLYFEGTTAKVTVANPVNTKTVSLWVRPTSNTTTILQLTATKYISATSGTLAANGFTGTFYVNGVQTTTLLANRWQHVVVTTSTSISADAIILGNNSTNFFKGFMDEVKLISTEYTAAQVKGEFTKRGSIDEVSAQFGDAHTGQQLSDGLVGYWKLDEASGDATDSSGNGYTLTNNGTTTFVTGKYGRGSEHVPASSQHLLYVTSAVNSYYFDATDSGPTDASNSWLSDANAFDGSTTSQATAQTLTGPLIAGGTTAPTSGGSISAVRARLYGCRAPAASYINAIIKYSGTSLGTPSNTIDCNVNTDWGSYYNLTAPSGGWTWQKANDLTVEISTDATGSEVYKIEIEVTSGGSGIGSANAISFWTNPDALTNYYVNLSATANIQSNSSGVLSANGFTDPKIYVNGIEGAPVVANVWQLVTVTTATPITADDFSVGKISTSYFDGTMDEVRLYNRMLDAKEVATIYAFAPSPVGYWKMDENTGTSIADISGNGGTLSTTNTPGFAPGKFGSALSLVGSSSQYASRTDTAALSQTSNMTLSAWIKPSAITAATFFPIAGKTTSSTISYLLTQYGDEIRMYIGSDTAYVTTNASNLSAGTWYHVEAVYTAAAQTVEIYINGAKAASTTTGTIPTSITDGTDDFTVGYYSTGSGSTTLSPVPEVAASTDDGYQNTSGLNGDVTSIEVRLGNSAGNPQTSGFRFTGIAIPQGSTITSATFKPTSLESYTCSGCTLSVNVKMEDTDDAATFSAANDDIGGRTGTTAQTTWNIASLTGDVQYSVDVTDAVQEVVDRAGWVSGNDMAVLAIDNGSSLSEWQNIYSWDHTTGAPAQLEISYASGSTNYYDGAIDDVKIYNYTRTSSQIIEDMNGGHPSPGSPVGSAMSYYKFDEGYSTTANDSAIGGNNLTLSTASWTNAGKFGKAFQGASNYRVSRADDPDFDFAAADSFSLSGWFNRSTISAQEYLIYKEGTGEGYTVYLDSDGDVVFGISDTNSASFPEETIGGSLSKNYDDGVWHHFIAVKDGTTAIRLYVDGKKIDEDTSLAVDATLENGGVLYVGDANAADGTDEFLGKIDELRFYRLALTDSQVKAEFDQGKTATLGSISTTSTGVPDNSSARSYCPPGDTATCNSPLAEWRLDENTGTTSVADTAGTGYAGTMTGLAAASWVPGRIGSALKFDGSTSYLTMATEDANFSRNAYSMSAWVYRSTDSGAAEIIIDNRDGANDGQLLQISATDKFECYYNAIASVSTTTVAVGTWYQVTCTTDGTTQRLYINGIQEDSDGLSGSIAEATDLRIGAQSFTAAASFFPGILDEVRLYDYARTPAQVAWNFNRGGPVAWYKMDEGADTVINDSSGNGLTGTLTLGASPTTATAWANGASGKINSSMDFDGADDYVSVTDNDKLDITKSITIAAWIKPDEVATCCHFIVNKDDVTAQRAYTFYISVSAKLSTYFWKTDSTSYQVDTDTNAIPQSQWSHVAVTYDVAAATAQYYLNGMPIKTNIITSTGGDIQATTANLWIGKRNYVPSYFPFDGLIDDVRIFNYSMSAQQIREIYNNGAVSF